MDLSIITVNWNGAKHIKHMLKTLEDHTENITYEVIVVDNNSEAFDKKILKTIKANKILHNSQNLGFGRANNIGSRHAKGKHIAFVNPDITFIEDTLKILLNELKANTRIGLIGPKLIQGGKTVTSAMKKSTIISIALGQFTRPLAKKLRLKTAGSFYIDQDSPTFCDWVYGSFMMLPRKVFEAVGGFDEQYFMYAEEADLCLSVKKAGYLVKYFPVTKVEHVGGAVANKVPDLTIWRKALSEFKFFSKWNSKFYALFNCFFNGCLFIKKGVIYLLWNRPAGRKLMKMGLFRLQILFGKREYK